MLACGYCLTPTLRAMQVGRVKAQSGVKDGVSEGVTLLGTPTSLHTAVLMSAVCLLHAPWVAWKGRQLSAKRASLSSPGRGTFIQEPRFSRELGPLGGRLCMMS